MRRSWRRRCECTTNSLEKTWTSHVKLFRLGGNFVFFWRKSREKCSHTYNYTASLLYIDAKRHQAEPFTWILIYMQPTPLPLQPPQQLPHTATTTKSPPALLQPPKQPRLPLPLLRQLSIGNEGMFIPDRSGVSLDIFSTVGKWYEGRYQDTPLVVISSPLMLFTFINTF